MALERGCDPADLPAADRQLDAFLAEVDPRWRPYYETMIPEYKAKRAARAQLEAAAAAAQERIFSLQRIPSCAVELSQLA
jgi:hypothetical protein